MVSTTNAMLLRYMVWGTGGPGRPSVVYPPTRCTCALDAKLKLWVSAFEPASERCSPSATRRAEFTSPFLQRKVHRDQPEHSPVSQPAVAGANGSLCPWRRHHHRRYGDRYRPPSVTCLVHETRFLLSHQSCRNSLLFHEQASFCGTIMNADLYDSPNSLFFILLEIFRMSLVLDLPCDLWLFDTRVLNMEDPMSRSDSPKLGTLVEN